MRQVHHRHNTRHEKDKQYGAPELRTRANNKTTRSAITLQLSKSSRTWRLFPTAPPLSGFTIALPRLFTVRRH